MLSSICCCEPLCPCSFYSIICIQVVCTENQSTHMTVTFANECILGLILVPRPPALQRKQGSSSSMPQVGWVHTGIFVCSTCFSSSMCRQEVVLLKGASSLYHIAAVVQPSSLKIVPWHTLGHAPDVFYACLQGKTLTLEELRQANVNTNPLIYVPEQMDSYALQISSLAQRAMTLLDIHRCIPYSRKLNDQSFLYDGPLPMQLCFIKAM